MADFGDGEVVTPGGADGARRARTVTARRTRKRRPNIPREEGVHTIEVVVSGSEFKMLTSAAAKASMTVPWYLVKSALNPTGTTAESGPWLPWPQRQVLAATVLSATSALDRTSNAQLSHLGANMNQIAHAANAAGITGEILDDLEEALVEHKKVMEMIREIATRMDEAAKEVVRR
ncbi:MobC family plasmid mobilization relaxosome protein [Nocardia sp. XZ_19_231]|uniref:MobC family plasmid mobilization relaxosome protein n=1 Tax=Nocardia sp. XZ_19_231 TaxID=2769252 RepID=UPI0018906137|nr:MobC family plasmid mobilization relaxosome protein [Nocardia sp. XZ_19_231]